MDTLKNMIIYGIRQEIIKQMFCFPENSESVHTTNNYTNQFQNVYISVKIKLQSILYDICGTYMSLLSKFCLIL